MPLLLRLGASRIRGTWRSQVRLLGEGRSDSYRIHAKSCRDSARSSSESGADPHESSMFEYNRPFMLKLDTELLQAALVSYQNELAENPGSPMVSSDSTARWVPSCPRVAARSDKCRRPGKHCGSSAEANWANLRRTRETGVARASSYRGAFSNINSHGGILRFLRHHGRGRDRTDGRGRTRWRQPWRHGPSCARLGRG